MKCINAMEYVRNRFPDSCPKERLTIKKDGGMTVRVFPDFFEDWILVDLDDNQIMREFPNQRADVLFCGIDKLHQANWVVPIECKGGKGGVDASDVVGQLNNCARDIYQFVTGCGEWQFCPILVHGPGIHRDDVDYFRKNRVKLCGKEKAVKRVNRIAKFPQDLPGYTTDTLGK